MKAQGVRVRRKVKNHCSNTSAITSNALEHMNCCTCRVCVKRTHQLENPAVTGMVSIGRHGNWRKFSTS